MIIKLTSAALCVSMHAVISVVLRFAASMWWLSCANPRLLRKDLIRLFHCGRAWSAHRFARIIHRGCDRHSTRSCHRSAHLQLSAALHTQDMGDTSGFRPTGVSTVTNAVTMIILWIALPKESVRASSLNSQNDSFNY